MTDMVIDCAQCEAPKDGCGDCVMSFLLHDVPRLLPLEDVERRALGVLANAGLVPPLRMRFGNGLRVV